MSKIKNSVSILSAAIFGALVGTWAAVASPQAAPPSTASQRIGEIRLDKYDSLRLVPTQKTGVTTVALAGKALTITSPRYQMSAPRINLTFKGSKVATGSATGGVQVTVKDAAAGQTTTVTCDTANYTSGATASRGRIDLKGTVRSKTFSPGFAQPLVSESESGYIEFTPDGPIVQLNNGSAIVTPNEPAPRKP